MEEARDRFFNKVNKTDTCWLWTGCKEKDGYARITFQKNRFPSHRFSWLLAGNTIPEGHHIRHKCKNKHCVNPEHLETGTREQNMADKIRDGTDSRGEKSVNAKLTEEQVRVIRANPDKKTHRELAEEYGVAETTISKIIHRKSWKHLL